jgi:hypothetical protein
VIGRSGDRAIGKQKSKIRREMNATNRQEIVGKDSIHSAKGNDS